MSYIGWYIGFSVLAIVLVLVIYQGVTTIHNIQVDQKYRAFEHIEQMNCEELEREKLIAYEKIGNTDIRRFILDEMIKKGCDI